MLPPRPLLALCVLLIGLLSWSVAARPQPEVALADAARWEGQSVRTEGWASDLRVARDGSLALTLVDGGQALQVDAPPSTAHPGIGDRVEAAGRLSRWQGALRLDVEGPTGLRIVDGPRPIQASWQDLSASPDRWHGVSIRLHGQVVGERLIGDGASLALGTGPWPQSGPVQATGLLRFDPACVCHRLDAREVRPWTP